MVCKGYSSPCAAGMAWVGWIAGWGLAWPTVVVDGAGATLACAAGGGLAGAGAGVAGLVSIAADCCGGVDGGLPATAGFGDGSGTVRLATCGIEAGGRGPPRMTVGGGRDVSGP